MRTLVLVVFAVAGCGSKSAKEAPPSSEATSGKEVVFEPVEPVVKPSPPPKAGECAPFALAVLDAGIWLGTGPDGGCFAPRSGGALDTEWLQDALKAVRASKDCMVGTVVVSGFADVKYQDIVTVMDIAVQSGLRDVSIAGMNALPVQLPADPTKAPKDCPSPVLAANPSPAMPPRPPPPSVIPSATGGDTVQSAIIVAVTTEEVSVNGKVVARTSEVGAGSGTFKPLVDALPKGETDRVIVQADQRLDMKVMVRVVDTLRQAGFANVALAVDPK